MIGKILLAKNIIIAGLGGLAGFGVGILVQSARELKYNSRRKKKVEDFFRENPQLLSGINSIRDKNGRREALLLYFNLTEKIIMAPDNDQCDKMMVQLVDQVTELVTEYLNPDSNKNIEKSMDPEVVAAVDKIMAALFPKGKEGTNDL